jgi:putative nucleotidyltransferase with HDIG domain
LDRLFLIRDIVDDYIEKIVVDTNKNLAIIKRNEYIHSYGVASLAQLLAELRGLDIEIAGVIGHLHDIGRIMYNILDETHARVGAKEAERILNNVDVFSIHEIKLICNAIEQRSNKTIIGGKYEELIKDADIIDRYLFNRPRFQNEDEGHRIPKVKKELNLNV